MNERLCASHGSQTEIVEPWETSRTTEHLSDATWLYRPCRKERIQMYEWCFKQSHRSFFIDRRADQRRASKLHITWMALTPKTVCHIHNTLELNRGEHYMLSVKVDPCLVPCVSRTCQRITRFSHIHISFCILVLCLETSARSSFGTYLPPCLRII
jgi:hypothetical protein